MVFPSGGDLKHMSTIWIPDVHLFSMLVQHETRQVCFQDLIADAVHTLKETLGSIHPNLCIFI